MDDLPIEANWSKQIARVARFKRKERLQLKRRRKHTAVVEIKDGTQIR